MNRRRTWFWYRRCATLALALAAASGCSENTPTAPVPAVPSEPPPAPEPAPEITAEPGRDAQHRYYRGYLADVVTGDRQIARENYQSVLGFGAEEPTLVADAALRLAVWAEIARERRTAMDLAVRASVLGAEEPRIKNAADALRLRLATTVRAQDIEVRGPKAGTVLLGVSPEIADRFSQAEELLGAYHRRKLQPRLEALVASIRRKRAAMERAVREYRAVVDTGVTSAVVAAEFRIASLHYDFSLSLSFELPGELSPEVAASMRSSLRSEVRQVRAKAKAAYMRSLAAAVPVTPAIAPWSQAASVGLASVEDLLRSGK